MWRLKSAIAQKVSRVSFVCECLLQLILQARHKDNFIQKCPKAVECFWSVLPDLFMLVVQKNKKQKVSLMARRLSERKVFQSRSNRKGEPMGAIRLLLLLNHKHAQSK